MITPLITRVIEFDAGHRVLGHESKCANLHGHRYVAHISVDAASLDDVGRVIDFSKIKEVVGQWIDDNWDHNMILHIDDPLLLTWECPHVKLKHGKNGIRAGDIWKGKTPYIMPRWAPNPTVENMVKVLYHEAYSRLIPHGVKVKSIRLYETPNCWADYTEEDEV